MRHTRRYLGLVLATIAAAMLVAVSRVGAITYGFIVAALLRGKCKTSSSH